jgi:hypothetical protein
MRKKGSNTLKLCWRCEVVNQNETIYSNEYATLKQIANDLGLTYSQVVELSAGRKKDSKGRYDTNYRFTRINNAEKLNETEEENPNLIYDSDDDNPSLNGFS